MPQRVHLVMSVSRRAVCSDRVRTWLGHRIDAVIANVALDLCRGSKIGVPIVDDVACSDEQIRTNEPSAAHHPHLIAVGSYEPRLNLDYG